MAGGGGEVGADSAEGLGAFHGAHAAGDLDAELAHPDDALGLVVIEGNPQVRGEPEVVRLAGGHPGGQGVPLPLQGGAAAGVQRDPGGGGLAEPAGVLLQGLRADRGGPVRAGRVRGLLQREQRVDGLPCPGDVGVRAGLGDRGQLAQHVRAAQGVARAVVAVIGRPGVVAGDPGEAGQHPGRVHPVPAALGVHGDQHVLPRRRGVDPGEAARDPEPGLVEVRDRGSGQRAADRLERRRDGAGDLPGHGGDRARRGGEAEQVRHRLAGPVPGQELPVPEVSGDRRGPRPVLDRGRYPVRRIRPGHRAAAAPHGRSSVLGDLGPHLGDLRDLPPDHALLRRAGQAGRAAGTARRLVPDHPVGTVAELHRRARLPLRPARLPPGLRPQRLRRRLRQPVRRRRPRAVLRVLPEPRGQVRDLRLQPRRPLPQLGGLRLQRRQLAQVPPQNGDLRVPLRQQRPQPRVRSAKPRGITGTGSTGTSRSLPHPTTQANRRTPNAQRPKRKIKERPIQLQSLQQDYACRVRFGLVSLGSLMLRDSKDSIREIGESPQVRSVRDYTMAERCTAVLMAERLGIRKASVKLGIPFSTLRRWVKNGIAAKA